MTLAVGLSATGQGKDGANFETPAYRQTGHPKVVISCYNLKAILTVFT